jgi:hypothetical protein
MKAWNIINPIVYALDYWFLHIANDSSANSFQGDIKGIEHYSSKETANIFAGSMEALVAWMRLGPSAPTCSRFCRNPVQIIYDALDTRIRRGEIR